jgi:hypothetical protein
MEKLKKIKDLSSYDTVFCDSLEALEIAKEYGLPKDSIVKTSSPAVILDGSYNTIQIDSGWNKEKIKLFKDLDKKFINDVYKELESYHDLKDYAHTVARFSYSSFIIFLYKASCIINKDLTEKRLILEIDHQNKKINSPWKILLANNLQADNFKIQTKQLDNATINTTKIPILHRLRVSGIESIIYMLISKSYGFYPKFFSKGDIFVAGNNELITEICYELAKQRYRIKNIEPESFNENIANNIIEKIKKALLDKVIKPYINKYVVDDLVDVCMNKYFEDLNHCLNQYNSLKNGWEMTLKNLSIKPEFIFMNSPSSFKGIALYNSNNRESLLVSAQHGVTDEISKEKLGHVAMEINASDIYLAYNDSSASVSEKSQFKKGKSFVVGMSLKHLRMKQNFSFNKINCPIVYIATNLYKGNNGIAGHITDYDRAMTEINFIENVLSKVPHKILYKSYPEQNIRYPDLNPVFKVISKYKNIELYDKKVDMRYLMMRHRVIITSRATSTVSWPMLSFKPLIFINSQKSETLNQPAYESLRKSVFLFDAESHNYYDNILKLLSLPISKIEDIWKSMEAERKKTIKSFFTKYNGDAGKRSIKFLLANL